MGLTRIRAQQITDIDYKQAVRLATTGDIVLAGGAPNTVDGVSLQVDNRVLVRAQSNAAQNGIYFVSVLGSGSDGTWLRTNDANQTGEIDPGMVVMVTEGVAYADTPWKLITNGEIIIGVTELTFEQFGGAASGANTNIQFNNNGAFAGSANLTWNGSELYANGSANITGNVTANYFLGNGSQLTGIQAGAVTTFSSIAPVSPAQGDVWIDADTGVQYIYFNDGSSSQWAEMEAATSIAVVTGAAVGGSNTQIQFNNDGNLAGTANLTWNGSELAVTGTANVSGNITTGNILTDGYYYANGAPFAGGGGGGGDVSKARLTGYSLVFGG
jgi:cytoskeletal protein CcmA (bactofilin family)